MTDAQPIPPHIWTRLLQFLAAGVNGQFVLNVHDGRIDTAEIREMVRPPKGLSTTG